LANKIYSLEYLPIALQDLIDIIKYISHDLANPAAAERLASDLVEAANRLLDFPYAAPVHHPAKPLEKEYRRALVKNYFVFYSVDEILKLITVARVIYARRNYGKLLD